MTGQATASHSSIRQWPRTNQTPPRHELKLDTQDYHEHENRLLQFFK